MMSSRNSSIVDAFLDQNYTQVVDELEKKKHPMMLCNRALAHLELDLYRRCLKDCEEALKEDDACLRAYHLGGIAYMKMEKEKEARRMWQRGMDKAKEEDGGRMLDLWIVREIATCLSSLQDDEEGDGMMEVVVQEEEEKEVPQSSSAAAVVAGRGGGVVDDEQQQQQDIEAYVASSQVPPHILAQVRANLTHASGR